MEDDRVLKMLKLTRILFFVNAVVWLTFSLLGFSRAMTQTSDLRFIFSVLMLANAFVMAVLGVLIVSARSWIFFGAILYMVLNVVLSIADQFGWIDALILSLNLIILGLLFVTRQKLGQIVSKGA